MTEANASSISEVSLSMVVTRCGCSSPETIHPNDPCPMPRSIDDLSIVSYWNKNPLSRVARAIRRKAWLQ